MAKKPNIEDFRKILRKSGGNLTKVAATFKVARKTIYQWAKEDTEFKDAISDERGSLVDECLVSARVLALGIPEKDKDGNFVGWRERPDGYMIRYLLSTLGKNEGFGEESEDADIPTDIDHGISIDSWIKDKLK
jgi:hypothetical protein|uniref:Terminase small subunit n=1 Tax=Siphoviridae sp. ctDcW16 TaxID=2826199 RepID=A0A8S5MTF3_9CAUD|nr:MAG TPA: terminase small subunit [Siphoviridae sp. ctDcW16]DAF23926.1 MAG TPA: terminase small subunit [Caudoviricetes sp.]DAH08289.1 MAG TPA: terminase small subunit [Caudoviricetes sp.]